MMEVSKSSTRACCNKNQCAGHQHDQQKKCSPLYQLYNTMFNVNYVQSGYDIVGEALDPEAHALVPPGIREGRVLAHRLVCLQLLSKLWKSLMRAMDEGRQKGTDVVDARRVPSLAS